MKHAVDFFLFVNYYRWHGNAVNQSDHSDIRLRSMVTMPWKNVSKIIINKILQSVEMQ